MGHFLFLYERPGGRPNVIRPPSGRQLSAIQRFCRQREVEAVRDGAFCLFWDKIQGDSFCDISEGKGLFFRGRDAYKMSKNSAPSNDLNLFRFPYGMIHFNGTTESIQMCTDPFGLFSYFYSEDDGQVIVTNHLPTILHFWGKDLVVSSEAQPQFLAQGVTLPGKTLFKQIHMSHPLYDIEIDNQARVTQVKKSSNHLFVQKQNDEIIFFNELRLSVAEILKESPINWITLTGGADSRLIFSTLTDEQRIERTYLYDDIASDPAQIPFDKVVVNILQKKYSLRYEYGFPKIAPEGTERHKQFVGSSNFSAHNHVLTGLFGGEIAGGMALGAQPICIENVPGFKDDKELAKKEFREHLGSTSDLFFCVSQMTSSFCSFFYGDWNWAFPYAVAQKKITPYLNTKLLEIVLSQPEDDITDFSFYKKIFRSNAPELMQVPFHSAIAQIKDPVFMNIKDQFPEADTCNPDRPDAAEIYAKRSNIFAAIMNEINKELGP